MPVGIIAAGVGAAGAVAGAAISGSAAQSAANTQASAENNAAQVQENMYNQTAARLAPYNTTGTQANEQIAQMSPFNFAPTEANLENTPGYQFNLYQGLKSTQNAAAARGLGTSGAALKGAANYATGLANTTYQNQFQNALNSYTTNLNRLQGQADLGESAASQTGNYGTQTAQAIGQTEVGAANAQAAGTIGTANAVTGGINGLSNAFLTSQFLNNQNNQNGIYGSNLSNTNNVLGSSTDPSYSDYAPYGYGVNDYGAYGT